jgi:hypothetical protein
LQKSGDRPRNTRKDAKVGLISRSLVCFVGILQEPPRYQGSGGESPAHFLCAFETGSLEMGRSACTSTCKSAREPCLLAISCRTRTRTRTRKPFRVAANPLFSSHLNFALVAVRVTGLWFAPFIGSVGMTVGLPGVCGAERDWRWPSIGDESPVVSASQCRMSRHDFNRTDGNRKRVVPPRRTRRARSFRHESHSSS